MLVGLLAGNGVALVGNAEDGVPTTSELYSRHLMEVFYCNPTESIEDL
jgi:hypothetical protein